MVRNEKTTCMAVRLALRLTLGLILLFAAAAKVVGSLSFVTTLDLYHFPLPGQVAAWTIALEIVAGLLLIVGLFPRAARGMTGLLLAAYWGATLFGPGDLIRCGCFGAIGPRLSFGQHVTLLSAMTAAWGGLLWRIPRRAGGPTRLMAALLSVVLLATATTVAGVALGRKGAALLQDVRPFRRIAVATLDGRLTTIDATRTPVLFFAWWCPHCEKLMKEMAGAPLSRRPVLVSTFFRSRSFTENRERTLAELRNVGLSPENAWTVYLDETPRALVNSVPTLAYLADGRWHVEVVTRIDALKAALKASGR